MPLHSRAHRLQARRRRMLPCDWGSSHRSLIYFHFSIDGKGFWMLDITAITAPRGRMQAGNATAMMLFIATMIEANGLCARVRAKRRRRRRRMNTPRRRLSIICRIPVHISGNGEGWAMGRSRDAPDDRATPSLPLIFILFYIPRNLMIKPTREERRRYTIA